MRRPDIEWHYLSPRAKCSHAREDRDRTARCGVGPVWYGPDGWYGTGSQGEHERAAALPRCKRCEKLIAADERERQRAAEFVDRFGAGEVKR